jgi:hypothetical protein
LAQRILPSLANIKIINAHSNKLSSIILTLPY